MLHTLAQNHMFTKSTLETIFWPNMNAELRAILQESEAKLEMKIFNPPSFFVWR